MLNVWNPLHHVVQWGICPMQQSLLNTVNPVLHSAVLVLHKTHSSTSQYCTDTSTYSYQYIIVS